jgi:hypothetical protein
MPFGFEAFAMRNAPPEQKMQNELKPLSDPISKEAMMIQITIAKVIGRCVLPYTGSAVRPLI